MNPHGVNTFCPECNKQALSNFYPCCHCGYGIANLGKIVGELLMVMKEEDECYEYMEIWGISNEYEIHNHFSKRINKVFEKYCTSYKAVMNQLKKRATAGWMYRSGIDYL